MAMSTSRRCSRSLGSRKRGGGAHLPRLSLLGKSAFALGAGLAMRVVCLAQSSGQADTSSARGILDQLLAFIYSLGHLIGQGVVRLLGAILPSLQVPTDLVDPIGLLAVLTIFLAVAAIAKRLVWIVVIVGWALILIRLILVIVQNYI